MAEDPALIVGAGTVISADQVDTAVAARARFVVSPGFSHEVLRRCHNSTCR
jgi:2-dehydro-3-deoxyphosphogluconate aldolase/(4S)-4-hydroxy-2-oxoglutarate aldolase